jgi:hypothetical protein
VITSLKHPEWEPIPIKGAVGVEGKVFLDEPEVGLAMPRFGPGQATFGQEAPEPPH